MSYKYQKLFEPMQIGNVTIKNRFAMAPMGPIGLGDAVGGFNQRGIDYYVERAKGGTGLIITGVCFVDNEVEPHEMPSTPSPTVNPVHFTRTAREMTERIHAYDAKVFLQLSAGFGRVAPPVNPDVQPVSASAIMNRWADIPCRALTKEEIRHIVKKFGEGAATAKNAGFDGIQIHAVHEGYLLDQFAISFFNNRTDEYGGSLENRLRFAREVLDEIKKTCGKDFVVTLRYSPKSFIKDWRVGGLPDEEFEEKGRDLPEGIETAKLLVQYGYDSLDVDVGCYDAWFWNHPPMYQKKGLYIPYAKAIKEVVNVPVICAGRMDNPDLALSALDDGACDMIGLGRPLLADADYVNKLRSGQIELIRPCLSCHEGCLGRMVHYGWLNCAVNPTCARERITELKPALKAKKIMIIGGGVAGCEAARVLSLRGHFPEVYEKGDRLGGNLIPGGMPDFKEDDHALATWYENTLKDLQVPVYFNVQITPDMVKAAKPDTVIVATGSTPNICILGNNDKVFTAEDVLLGRKNPGEQVVVLGGGLVGCELALWLRNNGKDVSIVEAEDSLLKLNAPLCFANSDMLLSLINYKKIKVYTDSKASRTTDQGVVIATKTGEQELKADSVVLAVGYSPENDLYNALKFEIEDIHLLGDARKVSNIMYAIWDAFEVASNI
ncbi:NAD(P)-binding protein [Acetobacterium paludosum]|uniref:NAD(P)-binding protein n=1 Tax=Acetobacterium paludosum TaxID=52693 RepID=A0A923KXW2_9FIRM|nr:FAD-dependent oxidoreductase [Acetobacterium paludosum]MBC3888861.1 NAD(P)-binding protein [Acetobacterium paludosum]